MTFSFYSNGIQFAGIDGDVVTTDGVQTLTNKTIDADDNTILNLTINNFKAGDVRQSVRKPSEASHEKLVTEKAVADALVSEVTYTHIQDVASDMWVIEHNLGRFPSVNTEDSEGNQFFAQIVYDSDDKLTVYLNESITGKAYLN